MPSLLKSLTITANANTRSYGNPDPSFTGTVTGFISGETQANATTGTLTFTPSSTITSNVGSYAINGSGLTANNGNYTFAQAAANATALTITKRSLDFSGTRVFDATAIFTSAQLTAGNVVNGDAVPISGSATVSSANVGTYTSFASSSLTTTNTNYQTTGGTVNVSIQNAPVVDHKSLRFTDTTSVSLGNAAELKLTNFTLEAWVKIESYGSTTQTGTGATGLLNVVPIITKGRDEGDGTAAKDINYFLGYQQGLNGAATKLVADFEDASSVNHPVTSAATIPMNTWTHVGASYDVASKTWKLFVGSCS